MLVVVHADLPALTVDEVLQLVGSLSVEGGGVVLAPDRHGVGTNALALGRPLSWTFQFGMDSIASHRRQAIRRGRAFEILSRPTIALDLDTPTDLEAWRLLTTHARCPSAGPRSCQVVNPPRSLSGHQR